MQRSQGNEPIWLPQHWKSPSQPCGTFHQLGKENVSFPRSHHSESGGRFETGTPVLSCTVGWWVALTASLPPQQENIMKSNIDKKFSAHYDAVEAELKSSTVGERGVRAIFSQTQSRPGSR